MIFFCKSACEFPVEFPHAHMLEACFDRLLGPPKIEHAILVVAFGFALHVVEACRGPSSLMQCYFYITWDVNFVTTSPQNFNRDAYIISVDPSLAKMFAT